MKRFYLAFTIGLLFFSCEKDGVSEFTDSPILESYLHPGDYFNLSIKRQTPFTSDAEYSPDDLEALDIQVERNGLIHSLSSAGDGLYLDSSLVVSEGDQYTLRFTYNQQSVEAYTYIPDKPQGFTASQTEMYLERMDFTDPGGGGGFGSTMPDPITLTWDNPDNSYHLVLVQNIESSLDPIRDFGDEEPPSNIFRKSPTTWVSEELGPREFQYYGTHRVIIYHVLPDYATLYEESSSSSQNLTNPSSSITNGYGIFTGMNSDTILIEILEQ